MPCRPDVAHPVADRLGYTSDRLAIGQLRGDSLAIGLTGGRGPRQIREPSVGVAAMSCGKGVLWSLIEAVAGKAGPKLLAHVPNPYGQALTLAFRYSLRFLP
jgi:hypothetical protein